MRILLTTNYQPPHTGGIQFAAESLKRCWSAEGHQVTWLSTDIPRGGRPSSPDNIRLRAVNVLQRWQAYTPIIMPWSYPEIARLVNTHDVINVHSVAPTLSIAVICAALRRRRPTVITQHVGVIPRASGRNSIVQERYIAGVARWSVARGARLTFVGRGVRDWFVEKAGIPPDRASMTPAGIDHHVYFYAPEEERAALRRKWGLEGNVFGVLFVGRFLDSKGIPLLGDVIRRCPDIRFTMVGSGPRKDPHTWGLANVKIIESVSNQELRELYSSHDLLIMPSHGEGWPAVICQGMACGLPAVVSEEAFEGYREDPDRFLVRPRQADSLATTLREAAAGRIALVNERWATSEYARAHWDWQKTAHLYLKLYEEVIAEKGVNAARHPR